MSEAADRLFNVRAALLQWFYDEALAGRHGTILPGTGTAGWPDPYPTRSELEAAATWLIDKGYAARMGPGRPQRYRLTPAGESVARSPQDLNGEQDQSTSAPASAVFNLSGHGINFTNYSPSARQSMPQPQDSATTATWTGTIAGILGVFVAIVGVVVAFLAWSPWNRASTPAGSQPPLVTTTYVADVTQTSQPSSPKPLPFTSSVNRLLYRCGRPHLFQESVAALGPPPDNEKAWPEWIRAHHGIETGSPDANGVVSSQLLVTISGREARPVTLTGLRVEAVNRKAGGIVGTFVRAQCGGPVEGRYVEVNLDTVPPSTIDNSAKAVNISALKPMTFPYRVTDTDTDTFYIITNTANYVEWRLHVEWSDGIDSGDTVIDDNGAPFSTSRAAAGTKYFNPSLSGPGWTPCLAEHC